MSEGSPGTPSKLDGTPFAEFAPLYHACARVGIGPLELDQLEIWQVAAVLGAHIDETPGGEVQTPMRRNAIARILARRGEGPEPVAGGPAPSGDLINRLRG